MAKKPIKRVTITLEGKTDGDIETATEEVAKSICEGYLSGNDSNETGAFSFEVTEAPKKELNW